MHVLLSGASGLVGTAAIARFAASGHRVTRLVRATGGASAHGVAWDPDSGRLDPAVLAGVGAVVHLSGASIAGGLWTSRRKERIRTSRIRSTRLLAETIAAMPARPATLVQASAVGYYGSRGEEVLTEASGSGSGFLADLCRDWEAASMPAQDAGVRVVRLRIGPVLDRRGGMLPAILPIFRMGLGGRLGSGRQWMPWITLHDLVAIIERAVADDSLRGAVNAVAPEPVTNAEFTRALGRVLHRPTLVPIPAIALRALLNGLAEELLLASERVVPDALLRARFPFAHPRLDDALNAALGPEAAAHAARTGR